MAKLRMLIGIAVVLSAATAQADDWVRPEPTAYYSRGFSHVAEIFPPRSRQNPGEKPLCFFYAVGYPGTNWTVDAHLVWEGPLVSQPYQALVSPDGDLVTLNQHGSAGYADAVVIYARDGTLVKAYALEELIPADELQRRERDGKLALSTSSRWWNREASYYFLAEPRRLAVVLPWDFALEIPLDGAKPAYAPVASFAALAALRRKEAAETAAGHFHSAAEEAEVWSISLRFSSITDVIAARLGAR